MKKITLTCAHAIVKYLIAQKILIKAFAKEVIDDFSLSSLQDISEIALDSWIDG